MDPQAFIKVSIGSLGFRVPIRSSSDTKSLSLSPPPPCVCEIRLPGFPIQTASIPFVSSPPDVVNTTIASRFYLQECDVKALLAPGGCFYTPHNACLEIVVFADNKGSGHCGVVGAKRQQIGTFKLVVGPEWGRGKPALLFNGWIGIGKNKELHLKVKLDPDPRYIFQFQDKTKLCPQIVQLKGNIKQPIFSCMFRRGIRVAPQVDPVKSFWSTPFCSSELEIEERRRERKGWKVTIHDLSGSAVAAAFIATPFVPSPGCDWVTRSNPGSWLIVHPDADSWQPWGKLEAWREQRGIRDTICCRFHLLCDDSQDFVMPEILISAERGGEFFIDTDKISAERGGFVMSCRVQGEGRCSKPLVQLAKRYVKCVEDAATFVALSAAVDLSIEACKPFPKRLRLTTRHSW